jgi:Cu/Ag efflux protein CusF
MKRTFLLLPVAAAAALAFVGCDNGSSSAADKLYPLRGRVIAVDAAATSVTIDHEDIPGLMRAMQMTFFVEDAKLLDGIKPGSQVEGSVKNVSGKYFLTTLKERSRANAVDEKLQMAVAKVSSEDRSLVEPQRLCPATGQILEK